MTYTEGKQEFINTWGELAINWGENRTVGQVHALLLISCNPMCADEIMEELEISRGNVNRTVRHLLDIGIIHKNNITGQRKDFFTAEKDMWKVMQAVITYRKKKELDLMIKTLDKLGDINAGCENSQEFCRTIRELKEFSNKIDDVLDNFTGSEANWLLRSMGRVMMR